MAIDGGMKKMTAHRTFCVQFLEQLSHIAPQDRLYADEAGAQDHLTQLNWAHGIKAKSSSQTSRGHCSGL